MWMHFTFILLHGYILKPIANRLLFKLIISSQTLIKLKWLYLYMCILMGKRLAVFLTVFIYFKVFELKMQK